MANERSEKRARKKRRSGGGFLSVINALLTLVVLGILILVGIFLYGASQFYAPGAVTTEANFTVEKGSSVMTTARRLEEQGLIPQGQLLPSEWLFWGGARALKKEGDLKAGVYALKPNSSMADILTELTEGKPLDFFVNVIPGDTSFQVAEKLNAEGPNLTGEPVPVPAEGTLLAVRYDFFPGDTRVSVLEKMQAQMKAKLDEIWAGRDPAIDSVIKSPAELVTMASIVEKETGVASERPQVAAVFINRLKKNMRLQTDPTVLYGVTEGKAVLSRGPTSSELKAKTAYNTYQIDGLPPGPIANPGEDALRAVAHPATTKDLYFVAKSANPSDGHLFAETYAQHRKNVSLYRKAAAEADSEAAKEALEAEQAEGADAGERTAAQLRECATEEAQLQARLREAGERVTTAEVAAQRARDGAADVERTLTEVSGRLGLEAEPSEEALEPEKRVDLDGRIERLARRREQLGPVNPLAAREYEEAVQHVEELEVQRKDLEGALGELTGLIKDTDRRIRESFEETFEAAAKNFEEVVGHLFPGGSGKLRLVSPDQTPRPVLGGDAEEPGDAAEAGLDADASEEPPAAEQGVEVEVTPAGKSSKRLSLLSGGEKSLVALAFMFAVFLARPCPFYILDEVEAALDDLNVDRFLQLVRRYSDRAQFIVVTHQKRTMDAADRLYGVSMGGDGVSKVVSRRLTGVPAADVVLRAAEEPAA